MLRTLALTLTAFAFSATAQPRPLPDIAPKVNPKLQKLKQTRAKRHKKPRRKKTLAATAHLAKEVKHIDGRTYALSREGLFKAIESPELFQRDVRVKAREAGGFEIARLQRGSVFAALGLENGDRLLGTVINGRVFTIKTLDDVLNVLVELKTAPDVLMQVERTGTVVVLRYLLE